MVASSPPGDESASAGRRPSLTEGGGLSGARFGDGVFYWGTAAIASLVLLLTVWLGLQLYFSAAPAIHKFGIGFFGSTAWKPNEDSPDPNAGIYGGLPYIYGTLYSSTIALLLAVPIGVGTAIFLAELAPKWMRTPLSFTVELLAAVPSVVYGLWGRLVLVPFLKPLQEWLSSHYGSVPLFAGSPQGLSMMAAGLILAIMVLPFITAVSREVIRAVPSTQREAAFGLGATHWEAVRGPVLKAARSGIIGAIILGLARALGETMAVTMVIGNGKDVSGSLLAPADTLASKIASNFAEASGGQMTALMYLALTLFVITIIVNSIARLLIWNMARNVRGISRA